MKAKYTIATAYVLLAVMLFSISGIPFTRVNAGNTGNSKELAGLYVAEETPLPTAKPQIQVKFDDKTGNILFIDNSKTPAEVWSTNPILEKKMPETSLALLNDEKSSQYSQITVRYEKGAAGVANQGDSGGMVVGSAEPTALFSYTDGFLDGKIKYHDIKNSNGDVVGLHVDYQLGDLYPMVFPKVITEEYFNKLTAGLSEKDLNTIKGKYSYQSVKVWNERIAAAKTPEDQKQMKAAKAEMFKNFPMLYDGPHYLIEKESMDTLKKKNIMEKLWSKTGLTAEALLAHYETFKFTDPEMPVGITVPVDYVVDGDKLRVYIKTSEIKLQKGVYITEFRFLQYLGSTEDVDDGYVLLPDGTGTLVDITKGNGMKDNLTIKMYGYDETRTSLSNIPLTQKGVFPYFGVKQNDRAMFALIEKGAEFAKIYCIKPNASNSYNSVFAGFGFANRDEISNTRVESKNMLAVYPARTLSDLSRYSLMPTTDIVYTVMFSYGDKANYSEMANKCREYFVDKYGLKKISAKKDIPFYMDVYGVIHKSQSFVGLPIEVRLPMTTFDQTKEILNEVMANNISNIKVRMLGWSSGGINNALSSKPKAEEKMGGQKGLDALIEFAAAKGIEVYPDNDLLYVYREADTTFDEFDPNNDASRNLLNEVKLLGQNNLASGEMYSDFNTKYIISPKMYNKYFSDYIESLKSQKYKTISLSTAGTNLNSDFTVGSGKVKSVQESAIAISNNLKKLKDAGYKTIVENGNYYALPYVSAVLRMPLTSSGYDYAVESVPFLQMLLHGYVEYAGDTVNEEQNKELTVLQSIESGAAVYARFMYERDIVLQNSNFDHIYSLHYRNWTKISSEVYGAVNKALKDLQDKAMIKHEKLADRVSAITYEDGTIVVTNYSEEDFTLNGTKVSAKGYAIIPGVQ